MPQALPIEVPSDVENAQPFTVPEGATVAQLDATVERIRKDADALLDKDRTIKDKSTAQRIAEANWLIDTLDTLNTRKGEIVAAEQAERAKLDELRSRLGEPKPEGEGEGDEQEGEGDNAGTGDQGDANSGGTDALPSGNDQQAAPPEPVLVASASVAARRRSAIADAASRKGVQQVPVAEGKPREAYLTAAADTGFAGGAKLSWVELGTAAQNRFGSLPTEPGHGTSTLRIGSVHVPADEGLVASKQVAISQANGGKGYDLDAAIEWALSSERLARETGTDGSLLASAGWCSPSETLYDLVDITTADGLLNIAGINVSRGGVRYSLGPDFSAVYSAGANFTQTEAQNIANTTKPKVNIPCPTFTDNRMLVDGMYFTGDILAAKGYPEAYADFTQKALKAFAHYVNKQTIADMVTLATAVSLIEGGSPPPYENKSATTELLGGVELQIVDMRYRNRMSMAQTVEVVFPYWVKGVIRSDMAKRAAVDNPGNITDAMIEGWFALRGAAVQWVYDWQDFFATGAGLGGATAATSWPTQVSFLIYPQGGFVRALSDVIELNAIYDSTLLTTNQYVALFMEQARLTLKRVPDVRVVTTKLFITGATGAAYDMLAKQPTV